MTRTRKLDKEPTLAEMAEVLKDKSTPRVTLIPSTKHTCIDALIDVEDDASWLEAMESKKDCPACAIRYGAEAIAAMIEQARK
jgi:hypothetical protein